jgi:hypothetical protein
VRGAGGELRFARGIHTEGACLPERSKATGQRAPHARRNTAPLCRSCRF